MSAANAVIEAMPADRLQAMVGRRLRHVVRSAYREVPFYRWYYDRLGFDPDGVASVDDLARIPTVTKRDLLEFQAGRPVAGERDPALRQIHLTSGTSGVGRESHPRYAEDMEAVGIGGAYEFLWAGLVPGERLLLTIPYSQTMAGPHFQATCKAAGLVPVNAFATGTTERVAQLYRFACAGLSATPSYVHALTLEARRQGRRPDRDLPSFRRIFVSGESYGTEWAREVEAYWGARVHEGWGATQTLGVVMASCELGAVVDGPYGPARGVLHGLDHRCVIEVLAADGSPVEPGDAGEIVVTTLRTRGLPSVRFRMGDRVRRLGTGSCRCGRTSSCFEAGTIGRLDDMIKIRGMNVWPSSVDAAVLQGAVVDYRGRVFTGGDGRERVEVGVELADPSAWSDEFVTGVRDRIKALAGVSMDVVQLPSGTLREEGFKSRRWRDERASRR